MHQAPLMRVLQTDGGLPDHFAGVGHPQRSVPLDELRLALHPDDRVKLANIRLDSFWLFEIAAKSYRNVMGLARRRS